MRILLFLSSAAILALPQVQSQQNILLRVDTNPDNRCMKAHKGGMWVLESPGQPTLNSPVGTVQVTLLRTEISMHPQNEQRLNYSIASGQTIELDCQGDTSVNYSIAPAQ